MNKLRSDSAWSGLPAEQKEQLAEWLLEDNLPYSEVLERAEKEFGVAGSKSSLARYYRHLVKEQAMDEMREFMRTAEEMNGTEARLGQLRASAWKMVGKQFLQKALAGGEMKDLAALGRLMAESEEREIQRGRVVLAREKFEFNATKMVLKHRELLQRTTEAEQKLQDDLIDEAKLAIFGAPPPGYDDPASDLYPH
jgi:hypothetical protein